MGWRVRGFSGGGGRVQGPLKACRRGEYFSLLFLDPLLFIHKGRTEGTKFSSFKGWTHKGGGFSFRVHLLSSAFGGDWDVRRISG